MKKIYYWRLCIIGVVLCAALTFSPLVMPAGVYKPMLWGIPYTLWTSFLLAWVLVLLTFIGTRVHTGANNDPHL